MKSLKPGSKHYPALLRLCSLADRLLIHVWNRCSKIKASDLEEGVVFMFKHEQDDGSVLYTVCLAVKRSPAAGFVYSLPLSNVEVPITFKSLWIRLPFTEEVAVVNANLLSVASPPQKSPSGKRGSPKMKGPQAATRALQAA